VDYWKQADTAWIDRAHELNMEALLPAVRRAGDVGVEKTCSGKTTTAAAAAAAGGVLRSAGRNLHNMRKAERRCVCACGSCQRRHRTTGKLASYSVPRGH